MSYFSWLWLDSTVVVLIAFWAETHSHLQGLPRFTTASMNLKSVRQKSPLAMFAGNQRLIIELCKCFFIVGLHHIRSGRTSRLATLGTAEELNRT